MDQDQLDKINLMAIFSAFLILFFVRYLSYKCNRLMKGLCPRQKMSCIGLRPRNMLSLKNSSNLAISWASVSALIVLLISIIKKYGNTFSPSGAFLLHDMFWFLSCEGHNIILILYLSNRDIPFVQENFPKPQFYQKIMILEPRRDKVPKSKLNIFKQLWKDKTMWDKKVLQISQGTHSELYQTVLPDYSNCYRPSSNKIVPI